MNHELNGGLAGARVDEMIARAHQYRRAQSQIGGRREATLGELQRFAFRRAVAALGLSLLLLLSLASAAVAVPADSGAGASGRQQIKSSHSQGLDSSSPLPVVGLSLAVVGGGIAILVVAAKRHGRPAEG